MEDNIDSMESLMTIFDCDLFVIEDVLLNLGECFYYDQETGVILESYMTIYADEVGNINILITPISPDNSLKPKKITALDAYMYVSKDIEELLLLQD